MFSAHRTLIAAVAFASTAHASIDVSISTSSYNVSSDATFNLDIDNGESFVGTVSLLNDPPTPLDFVSSSSVSPVTVGADVGASDTFVGVGEGFELNIDWTTSASASWADIDSTFIDLQGLADLRNQTRFVANESFYLNLAGVAALVDANDVMTEDIPLLQIVVRTLGPDGEIVYKHHGGAGVINEALKLDAGNYAINISTTSLIEFEGFSSSERSFLESTSLDLTVTVATIPASSAAILFPLAALTARRRRHLR